MKLNDGRITFLFLGDKVRIEIEDADARVGFLNIEMTPEQFTKAMQVASTKCLVEIFPIAIQKLGKKMEHKTLEFEMPGQYGFNEEKFLAKKLAQELCPDGWEPDLYFNTQSSFFTKDGKKYAQTTIRRWV